MIKADVERLRKLIEEIAVNPKVVSAPASVQMVPVQMPMYAHPGTPPPPPPQQNLDVSIPSGPPVHKMSEEEFNRPPSSGSRGPPVPSDAKLKEGHADMMKEMKNLFRSGKKFLKNTEEELKKEEELKSKEEKDLIKAEKEARRLAAEEVIDAHFKEIGMDLSDVLPQTKDLMVKMYSRLQEEKDVDKYKALMNATMGDIVD